MKKILILGSNFGSVAYLEAINKIFKKKMIDIVSPNIKNKKKIFNANKYNKYLKLIKKNKYDLIVCATPPKAQSDFIKNYVKFLKYSSTTKIMLEKPLSNNFENIFNNLSLLKKKKIIFSHNFIFPKINIWDQLLRKIKKGGKKEIKYIWRFKQAYFVNNRKTWKIRRSEGGGLLLFYLPHIIFNLLKIDQEIKFKKVLLKKKFKRFITEIKILLNSKYSSIYLHLDINFNKREHILEIVENKKNYKLENFSEDWTKNFNLKVNDKKINKTLEDRIKLTEKNIKELMKFNFKNKRYLNFLYKVERTYKIINSIDKKIYEQK